MKKIVYLPGDGVGPEVTDATKTVLDAVKSVYGLSFDEVTRPFGGAAIDLTETPFPVETKEACLSADAVFLGAIGGPKWEQGGPRPEPGLLELRKVLGVFANLRPTHVMSGLQELSPLKAERADGVDFLMIRELTGGLYFGEKQEGNDRAIDECLYTKEEVTRVARIAFEAARGRRGKVVSVDKSNVLATSRLWRNAVNELHVAEYADIELSHMLVDAMAMKLIQTPGSFDVILTENLFGDILSDEASVLSGSIGLAPSASLGEGTGSGNGAGQRGLYEPIHGSAPDIAGEDKANPAGAILSAAMMLRFSLDAPAAADAVDNAVAAAIRDGDRTSDLGGTLGTKAFADKVAAAIS